MNNDLNENKELETLNSNETITPVPPIEPEPVAPVETLEPVTPVETLEPVAPVETLESVTPVETLEPVTPVETLEPVTPVETLEPVAPVETLEPVAPVETLEPVAPVETLEPVTPMTTFDQTTSVPTLESVHNNLEQTVSESNLDSSSIDAGKPKKSKLGLLIGIIVVILALAGAAIGYYFLTSSPQYIFKTTLNNAFKELKGVLANENASIDFEIIPSIEESSGTFEKISNKLSLKGTLLTNLEKNTFVLEFDTKYNNKALLSGNLIFEDSTLYLKANDIYDKYIKYAIETEEKTDIRVEDIETIVTKLKDAIIKSLDNNLAKEEVVVDSKKVDKTTLTINKDYINSIYDEVMKDEQFTDALKRLTGLELQEIKTALEEDIEGITESAYVHLYTTKLNHKLVKMSMVEEDIRTDIIINGDDVTTELYQEDELVSSTKYSKTVENGLTTATTFLEYKQLGIKASITIKYQDSSKKIDDYKVTESIDAHEISEEDINVMYENISKQEGLLELSDLLKDLYGSNDDEDLDGEDNNEF